MICATLVSMFVLLGTFPDAEPDAKPTATTDAPRDDATVASRPARTTPASTPGGFTLPLPAAAISPLRIGGGIAIGVGVLTMIGGFIPSALSSSANGDLVALRTQSVKDGTITDDARAQAKQLRADALSYQATYNDVGVPLLWTGFAVAVIGGAALAASFFIPHDIVFVPIGQLEEEDS
jgi:hypothetical protein